MDRKPSTWTILTVPGGSSERGQTSISRTRFLTEGDLVGRRAPLLRERGALRAVERHLEHAETEDRALESDRRQRDADLVEQLVLLHGRDLGRRPALDDFGQHRRRCLRDRAPSPFETDLLDHVAVAE